MHKTYSIDKIIADGGYFYCCIKKGIYGLKQAARLANKKLVRHLHSFGYKVDTITPNLWTYTRARLNRVYVWTISGSNVKIMNMFNI